MNNISITNTTAVYAALQELGRPDLADLMIDISERCARLFDHFENQISQHD